MCDSESTIKNRPRLVLKHRIIDKFIDICVWMLLCLVWGLTAMNYPSLPDSIPTHFNLKGQVDNYGAKPLVLVLPLLSTFLCVGLTILNKFPHTFNFPKKVTEANAIQLYSYGTRLIRYLKVTLVLLLGYIELETFRVSNGSASNMNSWFIPLILVFILGPLLCFLFISSKNNKKTN
jgi:uncharacterized membrane protein